MPAPLEKTDHMSLDIIARTRYVCFGNFSKFYNEYLSDAFFARATFLKIMTPMETIRNEVHDECIFRLYKVPGVINKHREPAWHIPPIVPQIDFDRAVERNLVIYLKVNGRWDEE